MKLISWNVNGLRAVMNKGFVDCLENAEADFFCIQETKMQEGQLDLTGLGYDIYWDSAEKKGYSGTAIFTRNKPLSIQKGIGHTIHDSEGRVITLEYDNFYLVNVYTPNSQRGLARLDYRMEWEIAFRGYLKSLDNIKPVIFCGDLNVAHKEIDIANPKSNRRNAGFTDEEREKMTELLASGFVDTYRHFNPGKTGAYTWWSYMHNAREKNVGWRIDYFCTSVRIINKVKHTDIYPDIQGSDHCPVFLEIDL